MHFKDKVILISGATGGMGEQIARQLSKEECNLALFSRREDELKKISEEISSDKTKCIYKKCDVKNKKDVEEAVKFTFKKYGKIDIAILTAGILVPNPIQTFDSNIIINSMEINFYGNLYFIEYLLSIMKKQKSSVIAVVSTLPDRRGLAGWGAYGASKAAISWLVESLRKEAKIRYNIKFITIKPGSVLTPMLEEKYRPGAISAERAAEHIINGIKREKSVIQFPITQVFMNKILEILPAAAYDCYPLEGQKGDGYPVVEEPNDK